MSAPCKTRSSPQQKISSCLRLSGKHRPPLAIADMNTQATERVSEPGLRVDIVEPGGWVAETYASGENRGDGRDFRKNLPAALVLPAHL